MPLENFTLADTPQSLADGVARLSDREVVGVDVERADWDRYYRTAALIQVGGGGDVLVVDPLVLEDLSPLGDFLAERVTVFHALENDLGPLTDAGVVTGRVEDTAIAAAMLGLPTGLETLLRELLGVELDGDKAAMQRSDWEARPLEPAMLSYAAADVADLPELHRVLRERLEEAGRLHWYTEELAALISQPPAEERRDWTRVKGVGRLDGAARSRAHALWEARERLARSTDTAPGRIVSDRVLVDLASDPPGDVNQLGRRGVRRQASREFGRHIVDALAVPSGSAPPPSRVRAVTDEDRARTEKLRSIRAARAAELGIDAGVLCPSRTLMTALLADPADGEQLRAALGLRAWQWEQVGEAFCEALGLPLGGTAETEGQTPDPEEQTDG